MRTPMRNQRAFTLIELVTYISLVSVSLTLLLSFEIATQQSVTSHRQACNIANQSDALFQQLRDDVSSSQKIIVNPMGETLTLSNGTDTVRYKAETAVHNKRYTMLSRSHQGPEAKTSQPDKPYPRLAKCQFKVKKVSGATLLEVHAQFRRVNYMDASQSDYVVYDWVFRSLIGQRK
jgi:type II secretory pathway pseudopilin PulG